jgi:DNA-binding transcriptional MocR family regulator
MTLTIAQKTLIIWRLAQNNPNYGSRQIGLEVGCSHSTVLRWGRRWLTERTIESRPRTGRQRKTNSEQDRQIITAGIHFKNDSVTEIMRKIRDEVELDISRSTFNRRLLGNVFLLEVRFFGLKNNFSYRGRSPFSDKS